MLTRKTLHSITKHLQGVLQEKESFCPSSSCSLPASTSQMTWGHFLHPNDKKSSCLSQETVTNLRYSVSTNPNISLRVAILLAKQLIWLYDLLNDLITTVSTSISSALLAHFIALWIMWAGQFAEGSCCCVVPEAFWYTLQESCQEEV